MISIASAPFEDQLRFATRMRDTAFKRSLNCPGLKSNPAGFSEWKAIVASATSTLFNSLDAYADTGISSAGMMRFTAGIRPSAIGRTTRAGPLSNRARRVAWKAGRLRGAKVLEALC